MSQDIKTMKEWQDAMMEQIRLMYGISVNDVDVKVNGNQVDVTAMVRLPGSIDFTLSDIKIGGCNHEWTEYVGLKECFSYCKKCDEKAISDRKM